MSSVTVESVLSEAQQVLEGARQTVFGCEAKALLKIKAIFFLSCFSTPFSLLGGPVLLLIIRVLINTKKCLELLRTLQDIHFS